MATLLTPGIVIKDYRITSELLNMGQFANSYFAQTRDGTPVFFKQYIDPTPIYSWYKPFIEYQKELQMVISQLPSAIREAAIDLFEYKGGYYQVFPLLKGKSIRWFLDESIHNPSIFDDSLRFITAKLFLYSLRQLHELGVCHCDLKPENLFVEEAAGTTLIGKKIKLIDFDFSFFTNKTPPWAPAGLEGRPGFVGTPGYFSPEHIRGQTPSLASDVFTACIVLFEILCGQHPFLEWDSPEAFLNCVIKGNHPSALSLNPDLPPKFAHLLEQGLKDDPSQRPSIRELHESIVASTPIYSSSSSHSGIIAEAVKKTFPTYIKLVIKEPNQYRPIHNTEIIGQSQVRMYPDAGYLSAQQFQIIKDVTASQWLVEGITGVVNNTRLNGEVITGKKVPIKDGDVISVGKFKATIRF